MFGQLIAQPAAANISVHHAGSSTTALASEATRGNIESELCGNESFL